VDIEEAIEYPEAEEDPATRRGFDRLRNQGFTLQEVRRRNRRRRR